MLENTKKRQRTVLPIRYEDEKIPVCCKVVPMPNEWVSVALKEEFRQWCPTRPIMISAPTGRGKTSFVADIAKYWRKVRKDQKVLLLVNRTAIATQQKRELTTKLDSRWKEVTDIRGLELTDDFPDIGLTVKTYQSFAAQYRKMNLEEYASVILDEAHYFLADATFNSHLDQIFWKLPKLFSHARRVYMTATPGAVLPEICKAEAENLRRCQICRGCCFESCGKLKLYDFPSQFQQVQLSYYHNPEEIVSLVEEHPNEKFLIFTSKREDDANSIDKSYAKALRSRGITVEYLDRFSKDSDTWRNVCEKGTFEAQVLVCTSVLDCGVSFHDEKLRHIIVETTDKTEFLQMIGRKRMKANEKLNVYIRAFDRGKIYTRLKHIEDRLKFVHDAEREINAGREDKLIFRAWNDEGGERLYQHLLNYSGHGKISRKKTAYSYLRWREGILNRLLRDVDEWGDDSALPRMAHEWLDQEERYDRSRWLDYNEKVQARIQVLDFLKNYAGRALNKDEWASFTSQFITLSSAIKVFPHDDERKSGLQCAAINTRLNSLELPYTTEKVQSTYKIIHIKEDYKDEQ